MRRLSGRIRADDLRGRPGPLRLAGLFVSAIVSLAVSVSVGYLIGGWVFAGLLPLATIALMAILIARERRKRRLQEREPGALSPSSEP